MNKYFLLTIFLLVVIGGFLYFQKMEKIETYSGTYTAVFEGEHAIRYYFLYDRNNLNPEKKNEREITFHRKNSSDQSFELTYEGGRGFAPSDYIDFYLRDKCSGCKPLPMPSGLLLEGVGAYFGNDADKYLIGETPIGLFIFKHDDFGEKEKALIESLSFELLEP